MSNNFTVEQVEQNADVVPLILDFHVGQVTHHKALPFGLLEFTI